MFIFPPAATKCVIIGLVKCLSTAAPGAAILVNTGFFGLSDGWWLRLQADYDTEIAKASLAKTLAKIRPWKEAAEQTADAH